MQNDRITQANEGIAPAPNKFGNVTPVPSKRDDITPVSSNINDTTRILENVNVPQAPPPPYQGDDEFHSAPQVRSPNGTPLTTWEKIQIAGRLVTSIGTLMMLVWTAILFKRGVFEYVQGGTPLFYVVTILAILLDWTFIRITISKDSPLSQIFHSKHLWLFPVLQFIITGAYNSVIYFYTYSWDYNKHQYMWQLYTLIGLAAGHIIYWFISVYAFIVAVRARRRQRREVQLAMQPQSWDPELALGVRPVVVQSPPVERQRERQGKRWMKEDVDAFNGRQGDGSLPLEVR